MPYFQTETFVRGAIEKFCGKHVTPMGNIIWHQPPYQFTSRTVIHKIHTINRHYFRTFPFKFTFLVFHPYFGSKPAYTSKKNYEDDVLQYPLLCVYDNIDRYYGMKTISVGSVNH